MWWASSVPRSLSITSTTPTPQANWPPPWPRLCRAAARCSACMSAPARWESWSPSTPPRRIASRLLECFDLQGDGDLVADDRATGLQRHVDIDAEVLAVQHHRGFEPGDRAVSHPGIHAVELHGNADPAGHTLEREIAVQPVALTIGGHRRRH